MAVKMGRDPYARTTVTKESVRCLNDQACTFCGSHGRKLNLGRQLWRFSVERDSVRPNKSWLAGGKLFCSVSCINSYTG